MNNSYSKDVTPNSALFTVSSDPVDGSYCAGSEGVTIRTNGSEDGAAYQVYFNESPLGESVLGTGAALSFGPYTNEGVYRVVIAGLEGCLYVLEDAITVSEIPLPDPVVLTAENEGHFCEGDAEGVALTQTGFQAGVTYTLYNEGVLVPDSEWTASSTDMSGSHSYGDFNQAGTYTIEGTTILGECSQQVAEIELVADSLPESFIVEGDGFYCGPTGTTFIRLSGSEENVSYQLILNNDVEVGTPQPGTGLPLSFEVNVEGVYTVLASRSDVFTTCSRIMTGDVAVVMRDLPDTDIDVAPIDYNDADCTTGVTIELESSQAGVLYELYFVDNGTYISTGNTVYGDENGGPVQFPNPVIDGGGEYIVQATLDGCPADIEPKFEIDIDDVPRRFALIGSGDVCEGEDGADLWLSGSEDNVSYELWARHGVSPVQTVTFPHADFDTGEAFPFNKVVEEGAYYVRAVSGNDASCAVTTYEDLEVRFHKLPDSYQFTGTQFFCGTAEGEGAVLKLNDSEAGVVYSLMRRVAGDFTLFVDSKDGNDGPLEFSEVFTEGIYRVYARNTLTGCTSSMNGTVEVVQKSAPSTSLTLTANGYCAASVSGELTVKGHEDGVYYHLFSPDASGSLIQTLVGTGGTEEDLVFEGLQEDNLYTLYASWEDEACMVEMATGIEVNQLESPEVPVLDPIVENPTCAGEAFISVTNAQEGVVYTLINDELGTQFEINDEPVLWDYTFLENEGLLSSFLQVVAVNETTGCRVGSDLFRIEVLDAPGDFELISSVGTVNDGDVLDKCYGDNSFSLMVSNS